MDSTGWVWTVLDYTRPHWTVQDPRTLLAYTGLHQALLICTWLWWAANGRDKGDGVDSVDRGKRGDGGVQSRKRTCEGQTSGKWKKSAVF